MMLQNMRAGQRVRISVPVEIYPIGIFPVGATGTVSHVEEGIPDEGGFIAALVKLDAPRPELDEWDNELQVWSGDDMGCHAANFEPATQEEAAAICDHWVNRFGLGFHPDTRGDNYVDAEGNRCLTDDEARGYDKDMDTLFGLPGDPYEAGLAAMARAGLPIT